MLEEKLELATRGTEEVVTERELRELLKEKSLKVYCGYEPRARYTSATPAPLESSWTSKK